MRLRIKSAILSTLLILGVLYVLPIEKAQATDVSWIISTDTTWTKAGSPYTLVGNLLVDNGVTLTIQPGVVVNIDGYLCRVNGTIRAVGNSAEPITFNDGTVEFRSPDYGGEFNYVNFKNSSISSWITLKVTDCVFDGDLAAAGSSEIIGNSVHGNFNVGGSSSIKNNEIEAGDFCTMQGACTVQNNDIAGRIRLYGTTIFSDNTMTGNLTLNNEVRVTNNNINGDIILKDKTDLSHNTVAGNISVEYSIDTQNQPQPLIAFNTVGNGIIVHSGTPKILNNTINAVKIGIDLSASGYAYINTTIQNNQINGGEIGIDIKGSGNAGMLMPTWSTKALIAGNTIKGCSNAAIKIAGPVMCANGEAPYNHATIQNNYIANCYYGIDNYALADTEGNIIVNNIYGINGGGLATSRNNIVAGNTYGVFSCSAIENNLIINNQWGIIEGNRISNSTITKNKVGIENFGNSEIHFNNIFDNQINYNVTFNYNTNATFNWWGTTDAALIQQKIYDYNDDFLLGKVNVEPFLTGLNPSAPSPDTPIPDAPPQTTANPAQSPTATPSNQQPTPTTPEFNNPILLISILTVTALTLIATVKTKKSKTTNQ
jgi:hypothetical protein